MKSLKNILFLFCVTICLIQCATPAMVAQDFDEHWKNLFFVEKKPGEALAFCERWLGSAEPPIKVAAHVCLASLSVDNLKEQGFEAAQQHVQDALNLDPQNFSLHMLRINLNLFYNVDFTAPLQKSLAAFPDAPVDQWLAPLENWFQMQEYESISKYLLILDQRYPGDAKVQSRLGMIYLFLERMDLAEIHLQNAIALDKNDLSAQWSLARIYEMQKQYGKAKILYEQALKNINPEDQAYPVMQCLYTKFLGTGMQDTLAACRYASLNCQEYFEQNCAE